MISCDRSIVVQLRTALRLRHGAVSLESRLGVRNRINTVTTTPVRILHTINGRSYVIEVRSVGQDRWRAQIARRPGGMTSLMPFYGETADEAANQLAGWLARAGQPKKAV
jgi:hypothetical protein